MKLFWSNAVGATETLATVMSFTSTTSFFPFGPPPDRSIRTSSFGIRVRIPAFASNCVVASFVSFRQACVLEVGGRELDLIEWR